MAQDRADGHQRDRPGAGHRAGHVPAASTIFTEKSEYGLSSSQYGDMFLPQVALAIAASLLPAGLPGARHGARPRSRGLGRLSCGICDWRS